ncbi:hypothetical protein QUB63_17340 [Microcoleus sp. ARI1-B5]|jgi:hypothetical protein|uniref:hypothetical protein n=1 Tax=unclassified Microcoleus TaxID=2642155 RepID=UPI002FCF896C
MLPTDLLPKAQQSVDRLSAIDYEHPNIDKQRIRDAFSRHLNEQELNSVLSYQQHSSIRSIYHVAIQTP